ncbi:protein of unknown function [Methylocella tundrae]|uniref:Uncharacterized protein n=1 Tax=Methylocella tundrae TaxID=227605 RepID=A0A4U8Z0J6_METTU|nr:protein of unknown function [Methylocella tundrae]
MRSGLNRRFVDLTAQRRYLTALPLGFAGPIDPATAWRNDWPNSPRAPAPAKRRRRRPRTPPLTTRCAVPLMRPRASVSR